MDNKKEIEENIENVTQEMKSKKNNRLQGVSVRWMWRVFPENDYFCVIVC